MRFYSASLRHRFPAVWELVAAGGGRPVDVFGEWNGETLLPFTVWTESGMASL